MTETAALPSTAINTDGHAYCQMVLLFVFWAIGACFILANCGSGEKNAMGLITAMFALGIFTVVAWAAALWALVMPWLRSVP